VLKRCPRYVEQEIAAALVITEGTFKTHISNILANSMCATEHRQCEGAAIAVVGE
jgi:hypothetical protein